ncbi:hypothetical protein BLNAU_15900 [Blattamonas nauphoetae]|uniref:Uncharacterized protein n=1 Tax=Blattamonas nauphoetae TaxID=2049346 RepID=A0ABQ9XBX7_9EUKA|nr:hypothetical protein BLNAU_15900 [Blattamonas nauphoetae]
MTSCQHSRHHFVALLLSQPRRSNKCHANEHLASYAYLVFTKSPATQVSRYSWQSFFHTLLRVLRTPSPSVTVTIPNCLILRRHVNSQLETLHPVETVSHPTDQRVLVEDGESGDCSDGNHGGSLSTALWKS